LRFTVRLLKFFVYLRPIIAIWVPWESVN